MNAGTTAHHIPVLLLKAAAIDLLRQHLFSSDQCVPCQVPPVEAALMPQASGAAVPALPLAPAVSALVQSLLTQFASAEMSSSSCSWAAVRSREIGGVLQQAGGINVGFSAVAVDCRDLKRSSFSEGSFCHWPCWARVIKGSPHCTVNAVDAAARDSVARSRAITVSGAALK